MKTFSKDPGAKLDFTVSWARWLREFGDVIVASTWDVPDGITPIQDTHSATTATVWLEGGTEGERYKLTNRIETEDGRIDERDITVAVRER